MIEWVSLLFWLGVAHAVTDVLLQDPKLVSIGDYKQKAYCDAQGWHGHWPYWLLAHGLFNGAGVAIVTGNVLLGIFETMAHSLIDWGKCEQLYDVHIDQLLHLMCKLGWAAIMVSHA